MAKIYNLIRALERELYTGDQRMLDRPTFELIVAPYRSKPAKRIPPVRTEERVKRDRAPRPTPEALIVFPDGREVCNQKIKEGRLLYTQRTFEMAGRQADRCADCRVSLHSTPPTFDHESARGMGGGKRDDRIWTEDGLPMNAALCGWCNTQRGSTQRPYAYQTTLTREEYEAKSGEE
jgi:hypothetical protein